MSLQLFRIINTWCHNNAYNIIMYKSLCTYMRVLVCVFVHTHAHTHQHDMDASTFKTKLNLLLPKVLDETNPADEGSDVKPYHSSHIIYQSEISSSEGEAKLTNGAPAWLQLSGGTS